MSYPEQSFSEDSLPPGVLPPELAAFLQQHDYACVTEATDHDTVLVIKVPTLEIESVRGTVPIILHQALYRHPAAPVIQLVIEIFDQPDRPLALETFINPGSPEQRANYATLATQTTLPMLFYDDMLTHRLTKVISYHQQQETAFILATADRFLAAIPPERFNFELAKATVMQIDNL
jgi:hypothetical protein